MNNLSVHKRKAARELIEGRGSSVMFLPPYSADLNPIEHAFSKLKGVPKSRAARTHEALEKAIAPSDALGWFGHCGYSTGSINP